MEYVEKINALAESSTPSFICHYYNTHFAHTAVINEFLCCIAESTLTSEVCLFLVLSLRMCCSLVRLPFEFH